jgi:hypothetical protein
MFNLKYFKESHNYFHKNKEIKIDDLLFTVKGGGGKWSRVGGLQNVSSK